MSRATNRECRRMEQPQHTGGDAPSRRYPSGMSRWDRWEQAIRRTTLADQLMSEVAKVLWEDLGNWPPPIEEVEAAGQRQYAELLAPGSPVPPRAAYVEGIRLAGWDLERE